MLNPVEMKNKPEVISAINKAEVYFGTEPTVFTAKISRPTLEAILLTFCERFRQAKAASVPDVKCLPCGGSGTYQRGTGSCFRCVGKGYQTPEDVERNRAYDEIQAKRLAAYNERVAATEAHLLACKASEEEVFGVPGLPDDGDEVFGNGEGECNAPNAPDEDDLPF